MKSIFICYLNVGSMPPRDVEEYCLKMVSKLKEELVDTDSTLFVVPTREQDSKFECINPVYITDSELIKRHEQLMEKLNKNLGDGKFFKG